jgi:hypothetical protein
LHAATDPKHPIHPHLEWDDTVAAHRYRLDQVRAIIRCIRQTDDENHEPVHSFLSVSDKGGIAYRGVREVQTSATLRLQVLKQAERDLEAWERRYKDLSDICTIVASARARVRKRIDVASRTTP